MKELKNPYERLVTENEYRIIRKAEPYRSMFRTRNGKRIAGAWTPRRLKEKPGLSFCPYCGKVHIIYAPSAGVQQSHCYKEVATEDGDYYIVRIGTDVPDIVERAAKAWSRILMRFIMRIRSGKYDQDHFSCLTALYYTGMEHK